MLALRVYVQPDHAASVAEAVREHVGVRHVLVLGGGEAGSDVLVEADVPDAVADQVVGHLGELGLGSADVSVTRVDVVHPLDDARVDRFSGGAAVVWSVMRRSSRTYSEMSPHYLVYMVCAGIVAAFGILTRNQILVVGAMAISPDLLPVCAAAVALLDRRYRLAGRALLTLAAGFGLAAAAALGLTAGLRVAGYRPVVHDLGDGGLGILVAVNVATVLVAAAAGVAGILAFQTNASSAVGVAISVTTIPAATFLGCAVAVRDWSQTGSAAAVLAVNVTVLLLAGALTLRLQRGSAARSRPRSGG